MQTYLKRKLHSRIRELMRDFPAVAILGPRQCGKTTLALAIAKETEPSIYVDLERPSDARKLTDPELYFRQHKDRPERPRYQRSLDRRPRQGILSD